MKNYYFFLFGVSFITANQIHGAELDLIPQLIDPIKLNAAAAIQPVSATALDTVAANETKAHNAGVALGLGLGVELFGGSQEHDLALAVFHYGWRLKDNIGQGKWYQGSFELNGELFAGGQFEPSGAYLVGVAPIFRYRFDCGCKWSPFVNAGGGIGATDIGGPDLSTTFEFNLQGGAGLQYSWSEHLGLTLEYRLMHISNCRTRSPDLGVNANLFMVGINWYF